VVKRLDELRCHVIWGRPCPGDFVFDGDPAPPEKRHSPQFSVDVYCGQTFGRMKLPLGTEVNIGPGDVVLDGVAASPPKRVTAPPVVGSCLLSPNGWMDKTPLGTEVDLGPGHIVLDKDPTPRGKGHSSPLSFWSMSTVATVAHLSYC